MEAALRIDDGDLTGSGRAEAMTYALAMARRLMEKLRVIDFRSYEPLSAEAATSFMRRGAAQQVYQSMSEVMRLVGSLPTLILGETELAGLPEDSEDDTWLDVDEIATEGRPTAFLDAGENLDAACFADQYTLALNPQRRRACFPQGDRLIHRNDSTKPQYSALRIEISEGDELISACQASGIEIHVAKGPESILTAGTGGLNPLSLKIEKRRGLKRL